MGAAGRAAGAGAEDRELIESAALVANVGYLINFEGHHKHSYHLILNSELPGFERRQLQLSGRTWHVTIAARHPSESTRSTPRCRRKTSGACLPWQPSCVLRLALDRTHQQHVANVRTRVTARRVQITVDSHGDAEVDLWAAERKVELFEKVFGREVRFSASDVAPQKQIAGRRTRRQHNVTSSDGNQGTSVPDARNGKRRR